LVHSWDGSPRFFSVSEDWKSIAARGLNDSAALDTAEKAYARLAMELHPDHGGDHDKMTELNNAIHQAREALRR
jgi:hypothetical protein